MEVSKNKELILQTLHDMEDFAKLKQLTCNPIYIAGGSACILSNAIQRSTIDIDVLDMDYAANIGRIFKLLGDYDILDLTLTTIAPNFEKRAIQLNAFTYLDIFILSNEDIIATKIGRYSSKDKDDIRSLMAKANTTLLLELIRDIVSRHDLSHRVKEAFIYNTVLFRGDFHV